MENQSMNEQIGSKLRYHRKRLGLSQIGAAQLIGIDNSTLSKYEKGSREPDFETLQRIADVYDILVSDIMGETSRYLEQEASRILERVRRLPPQKRTVIYKMMDALIEQWEDHIKKE